MTGSSSVTHVSDTALWVAMYRAMESERPDALFRDRFARKLAGERGAQILASMPKGRQFAWPMIVRTAVMDEIILRAVERDRVDTVLNLAAGLDTRAYRLRLPPSLRWIDADLPDMIAYKEQQLAGERPICQYDAAKVDLTDGAARRALLEQVAAQAERALVITEGLLIYLTPEQVTELARDLHGQPRFRWWLTDLALPRLLKMMERTWGKTLRAGNAPFRFAPAEGAAFFEARGWRVAEFRASWEESIRLKRSFPGSRFWYAVTALYPRRLREELRRMSAILLLEPIDA